MCKIMFIIYLAVVYAIHAFLLGSLLFILYSILPITPCQKKSASEI